jgi:hypothetical protein
MLVVRIHVVSAKLISRYSHVLDVVYDSSASFNGEEQNNHTFVMSKEARGIENHWLLSSHIVRR